ncbi:hypothetical protein HYS00_02675, partial [Candidatus Microgenomates bacterium]|nr:hypothetical protein [Candidatus Microgenomates bacterium]
MAEQLQPREGFLHSYEGFRDLRMRRLPDLHGNEGNPNRGKNPINRPPRHLVPADMDQGGYVGSTFTPEELKLINPAIRLLTVIAQSGYQFEQDSNTTCAPLTDLIVARYADDESRATFAQAVFLGTHHLVDFASATFPAHAPALEGLFEVSGDEGIRVAVHKSRDLLEKAVQGTQPSVCDLLPRPKSFANLRVDGYERWEIQCPGMVLGRQIMASAAQAAEE